MFTSLSRNPTTNLNTILLITQPERVPADMQNSIGTSTSLNQFIRASVTAKANPIRIISNRPGLHRANSWLGIVHLGLCIKFLVPPEDFDPLTATDEELDRYCFPDRPGAAMELSDGINSDYSDWFSLMENYSGTPDPEISVSVQPVTAIQYSNLLLDFWKAM